MADSWESKFPHPGPSPEKPEPKVFPDEAVYKYNDWVRAMRKHNIAKAVDVLMAGEASKPLNAVETITLTVGVMLLDGSLPDRDNSLLGMFLG